MQAEAPARRWELVPDVFWSVIRKALTPYVIGGFIVPGDPKSKERPRGGANGFYTPKPTKAAEKRVLDALTTAMPDWEVEPDGTYGVMIEFNTEAGSSADLDNLTKLVWDALNGKFWLDDVQVGMALLRLVRGSDPNTRVLLFGVNNNGTPLTKLCECGTRYRSRADACRPCVKNRRTIAGLLREAGDATAAAELEQLKRQAYRYVAVATLGKGKAPTTKQIAERLSVTESRAAVVVNALIAGGVLARENRQLKILKPLEAS